MRFTEVPDLHNEMMQREREGGIVVEEISTHNKCGAVFPGGTVP